MRYAVVQDCPVPAPLAPILRRLLTDSGARLESCYRGPDAEPLLHRLGKHSQRELYWMWLHRRPGANPANPPGRSTHELRSDGVAYKGPPGRRLAWWQVGIDIDDAHVAAFAAAARRRGWHVRRPYLAGSEHHHLNFVKPPLRRRLAARVLAVKGAHR